MILCTESCFSPAFAEELYKGSASCPEQVKETCAHTILDEKAHNTGDKQLLACFQRIVRDRLILPVV